VRIRQLFLGLLVGSAGLLVACCACTNGCRPFRDNATSLAYRIEDGVVRLKSFSEETELVVVYEPVSNETEHYTVLLLPDGPVSEEVLVRKGVPWSVSHKILKDLSYVGVRDGGFIIVYQAGQINFTRYGAHSAKVKKLMAQESRGKTWILLRKENGSIWIAELR